MEPHVALNETISMQLSNISIFNYFREMHKPNYSIQMPYIFIRIKGQVPTRINHIENPLYHLVQAAIKKNCSPLCTVNLHNATLLCMYLFQFTT